MSPWKPGSELQIRRGNRNNSKIIFPISQLKHIILILNENTCCDPSLEQSWQDGSNAGS